MYLETRPLRLMRKGLNPSSVSLVAQSCPTLCDPMASLSITSSQSLLKLMSLEPVMPSNHLILSAVCSCLQSFLASGSFPVSQFFASGGQSIGVSTCLVSLFYKFCLLPHPPPPRCKLGIARKGVCLFHLRYWYCDFLLFYF